MKSQEVKASMLSHALYRLHCEAAVTEYGGIGVIGIADVFAFRSSGLTQEFEVKTHRSDLQGELATIKHFSTQPTLLDGEKKRFAKVSKHKIYLRGASTAYHERERPNMFSFVVPEELKEIAMQGVKGTPYGVYVIREVGNPGNTWFDIVCKVRGSYLHKNKLGSELTRNIMRKAATEVEVLRREIAQRLRCTSCHEDMPTRCEKCNAKVKKNRDYKRNSNMCWEKVNDLPDQERMHAWRVCMDEFKNDEK